MRILYFLPFLLMASCFSEEKVDIGSSDTFIRYFNGGYNDYPVSIAKTTDAGYIILSNMALNDGRFKIKLIKTDHQGNTVWTHVYPAFNTTAADPARPSKRAFGLLVLEDGSFVLAGENITKVNNKTRSQVLVMTVDAEGKQNSEKVYTSPSSIRGIAITENTHPDSLDASKKPKGYIVLGSIYTDESNLTNDPENMIVGGIRKSDLAATWLRSYGNGDSNLTNKIFLDASGSLFFGGTVTRQNKSKVRLVKTQQGLENTDFDLAIGDPQFNESGNDICRYGFGFAVIGSTNKNGERDIFYQRLSEDGTVIGSASIFPVTTPDGTAVPGNKGGNALGVTQDGGLLLAGTVPSNEALGFGRGGSDMYLIKIDAFGTINWQKDFGSVKDDQSIATLQADDGGYIILGRTILAGLETIMMMKTDKNGNVQ